MAVSMVNKQRILDLLKTQCRLFNHVFNPTRQRLGTKVLRQRLRGPSLAAYYPPRINVIKELKQEYPEWEVEDEAEEERLEGIELRKKRGKGAPKKRTAAESKKLTKRKPGGPKA